MAASLTTLQFGHPDTDGPISRRARDELKKMSLNKFGFVETPLFNDCKNRIRECLRSRSSKDSPYFLLEGASGSGKTRLALELVRSAECRKMWTYHRLPPCVAYSGMRGDIPIEGDFKSETEWLKSDVGKSTCHLEGWRLLAELLLRQHFCTNKDGAQHDSAYDLERRCDWCTDPMIICGVVKELLGKWFNTLPLAERSSAVWFVHLDDVQNAPRRAHGVLLAWTDWLKSSHWNSPCIVVLETGTRKLKRAADTPLPELLAATATQLVAVHRKLPMLDSSEQLDRVHEELCATAKLKFTEHERQRVLRIATNAFGGWPKAYEFALEALPYINRQIHADGPLDRYSCQSLFEDVIRRVGHYLFHLDNPYRLDIPRPADLVEATRRVLALAATGLEVKFDLKLNDNLTLEQYAKSGICTLVRNSRPEHVTVRIPLPLFASMNVLHYSVCDPDFNCRLLNPYDQSWQKLVPIAAWSLSLRMQAHLARGDKEITLGQLRPGARMPGDLADWKVRLPDMDRVRYVRTLSRPYRSDTLLQFDDYQVGVERSKVEDAKKGGIFLCAENQPHCDVVVVFRDAHCVLVSQEDNACASIPKTRGCRSCSEVQRASCNGCSQVIPEWVSHKSLPRTLQRTRPSGILVSRDTFDTAVGPLFGGYHEKLQKALDETEWQ